MTNFEVGDKVFMSDVPDVEVEVLEVGVCGDGDCCDEEVFRFLDPESDEDDWAHSSEFERVEA